MKKYLVVSTNKDRGFTLLVRFDTATMKLGHLDPTPFIVAWCYDDTTETWLAGHYFADIESAVAFMQ